MSRFNYDLDSPTYRWMDGGYTEIGTVEEAEHGIFRPCYCGADTFLGDGSRGHVSVCCSKTMQPVEQCLSEKGSE